MALCVPTKNQRAIECARLVTFAKLVPATTAFGENNRRAIEAQVAVIRDGIDEDDANDQFGDSESALDAVNDAFLWMSGVGEAPSIGWESLSGVQRLPLDDIERIVGVPAKEWAGVCNTVATAIFESDYAPARGGRLCYGHWTGHIGEENRFSGRPFTHHAWIEVGDRVLDATRWVFEDCEPYIYFGPRDHYDDGAQAFCAARQKPYPSQSSGKLFDDVPAPAQAVIRQVGGNPDGPIGANQIFHLANLPPATAPVMKEVYLWIVSLGCSGYIPIDFRRIARIVPEKR